MQCLRCKSFSSSSSDKAFCVWAFIVTLTQIMLVVINNSLITRCWHVFRAFVLSKYCRQSRLKIPRPCPHGAYEHARRRIAARAANSKTRMGAWQKVLLTLVMAKSPTYISKKSKYFISIWYLSNTDLHHFVDHKKGRDSQYMIKLERQKRIWLYNKQSPSNYKTWSKVGLV